MHPFPHHYRVAASGLAEGSVQLSAQDLPTLETMPPPEFDGRPGYWSPETLLLAAVADCFVLTFRSVARASHLEWEQLECDVEGLLEHQDNSTRFTSVTLSPLLLIKRAQDQKRAHRCLEKAEQACLITQSLNADIRLEPRIEISERA